MTKSPTAVQVHAKLDEGHWAENIEKCAKKFDEFVQEILKIDEEVRSNRFEQIANSIAIKLYDVISKMHGIIEKLNSSVDETTVTVALAKIDDISLELQTFVRDMTKIINDISK
jgi:type III secretion system FlhB-like substrate exporter